MFIKLNKDQYPILEVKDGWKYNRKKIKFQLNRGHLPIKAELRSNTKTGWHNCSLTAIVAQTENWATVRFYEFPLNETQFRMLRPSEDKAFDYSLLWD